MLGPQQLDLLIQQGRFAETVAAAREVQAAAPAAAWPHLYEGLGLLNGGDGIGAFDAYLSGLQCEPLNVDAHILLHQLLLRISPVDGAKAHAMWAAVLPPRGTVEQAEDWLAEQLVGTLSAYVLFSALGCVALHMGRGWRGTDLFCHAMGAPVPAIVTALDVDQEYQSYDYDASPVHQDSVARFLRFVEGRLQGRTGVTIVDAACGTGLVGTGLRRFAARLVGTDLSSHMLSHAAPVYDQTIQGDMGAVLRSLPGFADVVTCAGSTYYLDDLASFMAGAATALAPGGKLLFTDYLAPLGAGTRMTLGGTRRYARSPDLVERLAAANGLQLEGRLPDLMYNLPCAYWSFVKQG